MHVYLFLILCFVYLNITQNIAIRLIFSWLEIYARKPLLILFHLTEKSFTLKDTIKEMKWSLTLGKSDLKSCT